MLGCILPFVSVVLGLVDAIRRAIAGPLLAFALGLLYRALRKQGHI